MRTGTLVNALIAHCGDSLSGIGGVKRPGIVHRLDKDTTGLMVVAKSDKAHKALAKQFEDKHEGPLERGYLAFVWGVPDRPRGTIDAPLDRHPHARDKRAVREGGREAVTHWQVKERFNDPEGKPVASLIECTLETGRTHQIRVHLAHIGHPIMGDQTYATGFQTKVSRLGARGPRGAGSPRPPGPARLSARLRAPGDRGNDGIRGRFAARSGAAAGRPPGAPCEIGRPFPYPPHQEASKAHLLVFPMERRALCVVNPLNRPLSLLSEAVAR